MSAIARIELEEVRAELERAAEAANETVTDFEPDEVDGDANQNGDEYVMSHTKM